MALLLFVLHCSLTPKINKHGKLEAFGKIFQLNLLKITHNFPLIECLFKGFNRRYR